MFMNPRKTVLLRAAILISLLISIGCVAQENVNKHAKEVDMKCKNSAIEKSNEFIQFLLNDVTSTYPHDGGGGISEIK